MDRYTGQTPFTDEELDRALRLGTDDAARRQGALRAGVLAQVQASHPRRPRWHALAVAAIVLTLLAVTWAWGDRLPQWDAVQPLATNMPAAPAITLSANIQTYTPALSSVQGITLTARDNSGQLLSGHWRTSWGYFLGIVTSSGHLATKENNTDIDGAQRVMWGFSNADIPDRIVITFVAADGQTATLQLERDPDRTGFVRVIQKLEDLNLLVIMDSYIGDPMRNLFLPMSIQAVDSSGSAVTGNWTASYGTFQDASRNGNNNHIDGVSRVQWYFMEQDAQKVPKSAEITFESTDGKRKTLHLIQDKENPWKLLIAPNEVRHMQKEPKDTHPAGNTATPSPSD